MNEWNENNLFSFMENKSTGLIYFYTPLCGTCQVASKMLLVVEEMVKVEIGKMNLNYFPQVARTYAVESVPCLLFVKNGQVLETIYAVHSVLFLLDKVQEYVK